MRMWNRVVVHHSASRWGTAMDIHQWHLEFGWSGIGYHFVIQNGYPNSEDEVNGRLWKPLLGEIECGRHLDLDQWAEDNEEGAHVLGYNKDSIGICLIHDDGQSFDNKQLGSLVTLSRFLISELPSIYPASFFGHCELDPINKPDCPGLDMDWLRKKISKGPSFFEMIGITV